MIDTIPVREQERIDTEALRAFLAGRGLCAGEEVALEQFPGGHSNLTYLLRIGGDEHVLRRPPLGPVPPKAHDMVREARLMDAVHPHFPLAPAIRVICEDASVIGAPFYVMERRRGIVIRRENPGQIGDNPPLRRRIGEAVLDTLVALHAIGVSRGPLAQIGKPEGFLARQVKGWTGRWHGSATQEVPVVERIVEWLAERMPASQPAVLLHNDFKLDNVMLDANDPSRLVAVLDWEMAALGDPLIDLGIVLCYWPQTGDPLKRSEFISPVTTQPGWPSREELVERYAAATGRDVSCIAYYEVFALFKLAVVLQQIYFRYQTGQTRDERFATLGKRVLGLLEVASELAGLKFNA